MVQYSKFDKIPKIDFFNFFNFFCFSLTITKIQDGGTHLLAVWNRYLYSTYAVILCRSLHPTHHCDSVSDSNVLYSSVRNSVHRHWWFIVEIAHILSTISIPIKPSIFCVCAWLLITSPVPREGCEVLWKPHGRTSTNFLCVLPAAALRYVVYFRLCGWRHVFTRWAYDAS